MKKILLFIAVVLPQLAMAQDEAYELLDRIGGPGTSSRMILEISPSVSDSHQDVFVISSAESRPKITGSNMSALTAGIGWYLNHYAHVNLSWTQLARDLSKVTFPVPELKERRECGAVYRYYLNYCTFSYSTAFWTEERWMKEIDWMALHGVNMPLAVVGLDVVWRNILIEMGFDESKISDFIAGPSHIAWWAMNNVEGWGGPNPGWWYERSERLCRAILSRMRSLGMEPVLPGYSGSVPRSFISKTDWNLADPGKWGDVFHRPAMVQPTDPHFSGMAERYYRHLEQVMGKSKFYSMDLFHEGGRTEGVDIPASFQAVYSEMLKHSNGSKWVIQSWYKNPTKEALGAIPTGGFIVLDLFSDGVHKWKEAYEGHEFIYCMLHNFGGRTGMHGRLKSMMENYFLCMEMHPETVGVGATPEAIESDPVMYDALFELPWMRKEELSGWLPRYVVSRYSGEHPDMLRAYDLLAESVYACPGPQEGTTEAVVCSVPSLDVKSVSTWGTAEIYHDIEKVREAAGFMLEAKDELRDDKNYQYDFVNVVRQAMTDSAYYALKSLADDFVKCDSIGYNQGKNAFLDLIKDLDRMLATMSEFRLDTWLNMASAITDEHPDSKPEDREWLLWGARNLITLWGNKEDSRRHRDYSYREWSGMLGDYYLKRWQMFFECMERGEDIPYDTWADFGEKWTHTTTVYPPSSEHPVSVAAEMFSKYFPDQNHFQP